MGFRQSDINKFVATTYDFEKQVKDEVRRIIKTTLEMIRDIARAEAPVDTGELKASIQIFMEADGLSGRVMVGAEHGIWVEFGTGIYSTTGSGRKTPWVYYSEKLGQFVYTRGNPAQPYFYPAFDRAAIYFKRECNKLG